MVMSNAGQVSKAIAEACGPEVQSECRGLGPQPGGSAVLTTAGNLRARHIIHLIPISSTKQHLQICLEVGLQLADETGLHSISLPAIGSGGFGMSDVISAKMIFGSLGNFRKTCKHIRKVKIVVLQEKMIGTFRQEKTRQATGHYDEIALEVWISANDAESVSRAADTLKSDLSGECSYEEVCDEGVSKLSDEQLKGPLQQACKGEVDMSVEAAENRISLRGDQAEENKLLPEIYKEIVSSKKQEEERQAKENASMVSKTVEWVYELDGKKGVFSSKTNHTLEMAHSKEHRSVNVSLEGDEFAIDLSEKMGCGRHSNKRMTVFRRLKQAEEIPLPDHWSLMTTDEVLSVPLDTNLREYQQVLEKFSHTLGGVNITRIHRIQCPFRYRSYTLRKQKMEKDIGDVNERQLFHGASANITAAINLQGFNRSYCGKHGTVYGQGVYFARDAKYSLSYTSNEDNERCIYLARVLVGQYCVGDSSMKAPPAKDPSRPEVLYDSTVDNKENPSIFVAFSDDQCYPEYLLYFQWNPPAST